MDQTDPTTPTPTSGQVLIDKPYLEQNIKLLKEILHTLNSQQLTKSMSDEFAEILKNNQVLSNAIESAEKRCYALERKLERKRKYENCIKNCQRLQCRECNKLYTPSLFSQHFQLCKK